MKQVILVRRDLNMNIGKTAAQVAHAAMLFLLETIRMADRYIHQNIPIMDYFSVNEQEWMFGEINTIEGWKYGGIKKIVLGVADEDELYLYASNARAFGLKVHFVTDEGLQCVTCCAIGPHSEEEIDKITGGLKLLGR
jgi:PTH2 family peptidyl-tRNA hydrolase